MESKPSTRIEGVSRSRPVKHTRQQHVRRRDITLSLFLFLFLILFFASLICWVLASLLLFTVLMIASKHHATPPLFLLFRPESEARGLTSDQLMLIPVLTSSSRGMKWEVHWWVCRTHRTHRQAGGTPVGRGGNTGVSAAREVHWSTTRGDNTGLQHVGAALVYNTRGQHWSTISRGNTWGQRWSTTFGGSTGLL